MSKARTVVVRPQGGAGLRRAVAFALLGCRQEGLLLRLRGRGGVGDGRDARARARAEYEC